MSFIASNYTIFLVIAIVLLLGLFGYMMDRKKYEKYREEIINEERVAQAMESVGTVPDDKAMQTKEEEPTEVLSADPMQPASSPLDGIPDVGAMQAPLSDPLTGEQK